jgi:hypothetical protein
LYKRKNLYEGRVNIGVIMIEYTKHKIIRNREINREYSEVVFEKRDMAFVPGCQVTIHGSRTKVYLASGIQEPWARVILNSEESKLIPTGAKSIKLTRSLYNKVPDLMEANTPTFVITAAGISPFFSYASSFAGKRYDVLYMGEDKIQEDWVTSFHNSISLADLHDREEVYILGDKDILSGLGDKIIKNGKVAYS